MNFEQAFQKQLEKSQPIDTSKMVQEKTFYGKHWKDGDIMLFFMIEEQNEISVVTATPEELSDEDYYYEYRGSQSIPLQRSKTADRSLI